MAIFGAGLDITGQSIIFFGIGLMLAGLIGLICFPFVHNRAVRLTTRRLEAMTPSSMREMQADKDHLRAEFAMSTRRLEGSVEELKNKAIAHQSALGEKSTLIHKLRSELEERAARIQVLEARENELEASEKSLYDQLRAAKEDVIIMTNAMRSAELAEADARAEKHRVEALFDERALLVENQRREIKALQTQVDTIRHQVYDLASAIIEDETRPIREWVEKRDSTMSRNSSTNSTTSPVTNGANSGGALQTGSVAYDNGNTPINDGKPVLTQAAE